MVLYLMKTHLGRNDVSFVFCLSICFYILFVRNRRQHHRVFFFLVIGFYQFIIYYFFFLQASLMEVTYKADM